MLRLLKIELSRAIKNKLFLASIFIGCVVTVSHVVQNVIPMVKFLPTSFYKAGYPHSVFNKWIGGESYSLQPTLYCILIPIIASLPFAATLFTDTNSGFIKNIFIREKKVNYYIAKYIAVFVSAGVAIVFPLLLNLYLTAMILPSAMPEISTSVFPLTANSMWSGLFYSNPYAYIFLYLGIDFVFAGLIASIALTLSFYLNNRFIVLLSPFIIYLFIFTMFNVTGLGVINPMYFLRPTQQARGLTFTIILCAFLVTFIPSFGIYMMKGKRDDVY